MGMAQLVWVRINWYGNASAGMGAGSTTGMGMAQLVWVLWVRLSDYMDNFGIDPRG